MEDIFMQMLVQIVGTVIGGLILDYIRNRF